jgi:hypothetical protein
MYEQLMAYSPLCLIGYIFFNKEFNQINTLPINYSRYTAREMAYDREMHDIVNLIDFFSEKTHWKIVQFIGKKFLKLSDREIVTSKIKEELRRMYKKRVEIDFLKKKRRASTQTQSTDDQFPQIDDEALNSYMKNLYDDADNLKPKSDDLQGMSVTSTDITANMQKTNIQRFKPSIHSSLAKRYVETNPNNHYSLSDAHEQKKMSFRGYTMVFNINYVDETKNKSKKRIVSLKDPSRIQEQTTSMKSQTRTVNHENPMTTQSMATRPLARSKLTTATNTKQHLFTYKQKILSSSLSINNSLGLDRSREKINESYMKSLKKSGLWNNYCTPIMRPN